MKELTLKEQQQLELKIMEDVHNLCEKQGIKYFLGYGTLLGAIRHKGFIPWDDDIDICMQREDYEKFINLVINGALGKEYVIQNLHTDKEFEFILSRVGLKNTYTDTPARRKMKCWNYCYIDVFPLDYVDKDNMESHEKQVMLVKKLIRARMNYQYDSNSPIKKLIKTISSSLLSMISINSLARKHEQIARKYTNGEYVISTASSYKYVKNAWPLKEIENTVLTKFEDKKYYIPTGYDVVLKSLYKDYMTLPPESERICKHKAYILEKGDKGYKEI